MTLATGPQPSSVAPPTPPGVRPHHVYIPAGLFLLILVLAVVPWIWQALRSRQAPTPAPPSLNPALPAAPGIEVRTRPWGELESIELILMPTEELIPPGWADPKPVQWYFQKYTVEQLAEWFRGLPLSPDHRNALTDLSRWRTDEAGVVVTVPDEVAIGLAPTSRAAIYRVLIRDDRNASHTSPWSLRTNLWRAAYQTAGISDQSRTTLERSAHYEQGRLYVADVLAVLNQTPSREEKSRIVRLTSSASARLVRLRIRPDSDLGDLMLYWAGRGRRKDLRPIFEAIKAMPGGGTIDICHLLPAFARQRIFTYPHPAQAADGVRRDCHWTSLNFFSVVPDDRFGNPNAVQQHILQHYYPVGDSPPFGDVVFFSRPDGSVVHSAVYLAANYVFTKNGDNATTVDHHWT